MAGPTRKRGYPKIGPTRTKAMLQDIFEARHDLSGLAESYRLNPAQLSAWGNDAENRAVLQGLCVLADLQTQLMLSRYRQLAVGELIRQATGGGGGEGGEGSAVSPEQARKACVDLLRADLKLPATAMRGADDAESAAGPEAQQLSALRDAIYGTPSPSDATLAGDEG